MAESQSIGDIFVEFGAKFANLDLGGSKFKQWIFDRRKESKEASEAITQNWTKTGLFVSGIVTGVVLAVRNATKSMDEAGKSAQALGMSSEQFTRLQYAAQMAGVQTQELAAALTALSRRMGERDEISEGVRLFTALGVSVKDSSGKIKEADVLFGDLAERFSRMKDSFAKTELAVRLFGDSGRKLIPFLNQGKAGVQDLMNEADRLGVTLSGETTKAAEEFNDTIARISSSVASFTRRVVNEALPALQFLARDMELSVKEANNNSYAFKALDGTFKLLLTTGEAVKMFFNGLTSIVGGVVAATVNLLQGRFKDALKNLAGGVNEALEGMGKAERNVNVIWSGWVTSTEKAASKIAQGTAPIVQSSEELQKALNAIKLANQYAFQDLMNSDFKPYAQKVSELEQMWRRGAISFREFDAAMRELNKEAGGNALKEILETDTQPFAAKLEELRDLWVSNSIGVQQYNDAMKMVAGQQKQAMDDLLSTTSTALTTIFSKSKAAAIASALINTYQGITKALSSYPPPYSYAMAAAQAAMGFAQVAKIKSTSQDGGGGGGGSVAPAATTAPADAGPAPREQSLMVHGLDPRSLLSGDMVRDLAKRLLDFQRDGGRVVLT